MSVDIRYYPPKRILSDFANDPTEVARSANIDLFISFYNSRTNNLSFKSNAGAVQLYHIDGETKYDIPGQPYREYNVVSKRIKDSTYGHAERILMRNVLYELMSSYGDGGNLEFSTAPNHEDHEFGPEEIEDLRQLTDRAGEYNDYLKRKKIVVKMLSERPPCCFSLPGGGCYRFLKEICPEGSQIGYIVQNDCAKDEVIETAYNEFSAMLDNHLKARSMEQMMSNEDSSFDVEET